MVVWKFPLNYGGSIVSMPRGAEILHGGMDTHFPAIWAIVDPLHHLETRAFSVVGTGNNVPEGSAYIATVHQPPLVWHIFEIGR